ATAPITTCSTLSGTASALHNAERKYSKRCHGADRVWKNVVRGSALGPAECATSASSGEARSQMKRLVAPTKAYSLPPNGTERDGLTVYSSPGKSPSNATNRRPSHGM